MAKSGGGLISGANKGTMPMSKGTSAPQNTSVGSGSRPVRSKIDIASSAPSDPYGLDGRKTSGALK